MLSREDFQGPLLPSSLEQEHTTGFLDPKMNAANPFSSRKYTGGFILLPSWKKNSFES